MHVVYRPRQRDRKLLDGAGVAQYDPSEWQDCDRQRHTAGIQMVGLRRG